MTVIQTDAGRSPRAGLLAGSASAVVRDGVPYEIDIAPVAALLADRARAAMLMRLLDGLPRAAGNSASWPG
jgi:hypothetical protein